MENDELNNVNKVDSSDVASEKANEEKVEAIFSDYVMKLPESEKDEKKVITEPNRPAHWSQRIAAGLIDLCILFMAYIGFYQLFMQTGIGDALKAENKAIREVDDYYKTVPLLEESDETYGYKIYENEEAYQSDEYKNYPIYVDESLDLKYIVVDYPEVTDELKAAYEKALSTNEKRKTAISNGNIIVFGLNCLAGGISETIFLLVIPLVNKDRASLGKLAAGLKVISSKYQVEAKWYQMTGRFIWTLSIESVLMLLFLPTIGSFSNVWLTLIVVPVLLFLITLTNKDRRTLHDFVARTRVIDKRTYVPLNEQ